MNIRNGDRLTTYGIGGKETLYFHKIKVGIIVREEMWRINCHAGFSTKLNERGVGLLGRIGFFDVFQEVAFNQSAKMFRLKESSIESESSDSLYD